MDQDESVKQDEMPVRDEGQNVVAKEDEALGGNEEIVQGEATADTAVKDDTKKTFAIVAGVSVLIVGVIVALLLLLPRVSDGSVVGRWACYEYGWYSDQLDDEPINELILNADGSFVYGPYGDTKNNHYAGDYVASRENKEASDGYEYYIVEFGPTKEYILEGEVQDTTGRQMGVLEMGIKNGEKGREASVVFEHNYNTYYCLAE